MAELALVDEADGGALRRDVEADAALEELLVLIERLDERLDEMLDETLE